MKAMHWIVLAACGTSVLTPLTAQGVSPGSRGGRTVNTPRLMIANPYVTSGADSQASVSIGAALRQAVFEMVGDDYQVVTREQMNEALDNYGYPQDAILNPSLAVTLATNIATRIVITSTMTKNQDDLYTVTARLAGVSDAAGNLVTLAQHPGEQYMDFGYRLAEALRPATKSLGDAKECIEYVQLDSSLKTAKGAEKALKAANKAVKRLPSHGLAHYCLYLLAIEQKQPPQAAAKSLETAVQGDSLSVPLWRELLAAYQRASDTTNIIVAAKQLLRLAPSNQELREGLFKDLLRMGQTKAALEVADEGLKVDSGNAELYNLRAFACFALSDLKCAADALEHVYSTDSSKVDTAYFVRWGLIANSSTPVDTTRLLNWSEIGARKFPENVTILTNLHQAYMLAGQADSGLAVTRRLIAVAPDSAAILPALISVRLLAEQRRMVDAGPFVEYIKDRGAPGRKMQLGQILVVAAFKYLQGDSAAGEFQDFARAAELARTAVGVVPDTGSEVAQNANFALGAALLQRGSEVYKAAESEKSCDLAREEQQLMVDAKQALSSVRNGRYLETATKYLTYIDEVGPQVTRMLKTYCR